MEAHLSVSRSNPAAIEDSRWPKGWRARALRLQLEAEEAGATADEVATVNGWMLDPAVGNSLDDGQPTPAQLRDLARIEAGTRAWLRARGRTVRDATEAP